MIFSFAVTLCEPLDVVLQQILRQSRAVGESIPKSGAAARPPETEDLQSWRKSEGLEQGLSDTGLAPVTLEERLLN